MKIPDAVAVYLPSPSTARLKIPPHITEVQRPHNTRNITPMGTSAKPNEISDWNTGIDTFVSRGPKIPSNTKIRPTVDATANIALLETFAARLAPATRPINIRNQYV